MRVLSDHIAIVGMAGLFPGAPDLSAFWANILGKRCCISDHPAPEAQRVLDPESTEFNRLYTIRGGYLGDAATFDPLEHGVMPGSVEGGDPNHFLALRVAAGALDDAGLSEVDFPRERTDLILGHGTYVNPGNANWIQHGLTLDQTLDLVAQLAPQLTLEELDGYRTTLKAELPPLGPENIPTLIPNIITGRIANRLDLMGTNYIVDAACASSLIAVDHAVNHLLLNRCDVALAGGVLACMPLQGLMVFNQLQALSRKPALRPFDREADGTMLAEGVGVVVLKRLKDAERDGHRIYAVIRGVGVSSDGRSKGLMAPRKEGETLAIQRAYEAAVVEPQSVGLIEAHGTGIPLGDAAEIHALTDVFGRRNGKRPTCAVGSVKSGIGHCIAAAGVAGLIKAALALHTKILPPTVNCDEPHPDLELGGTPFYMNTETRPWIHGAAKTPRRAGVSAMGFGGINAHCVLEEWAP